MTIVLPDHRIHFIYPFLLGLEIERPQNYIANFTKLIEGVRVGSVIHKLSQRQGVNGTSTDSLPAWSSFESGMEDDDTGVEEDDKYFLPSADLLPHISALAGGRAHQNAQLTRHWQLAETILETIQTEKPRVLLNGPALRRLGFSSDAGPLMIVPRGIYVTAFATGVSFVHVVVTYAVADDQVVTDTGVDASQLILEANYALCHRKKTYQSPVAAMAESVISSFGLDGYEIKRRRTFIFSGVSFNPPTAETDSLAVNLATKLTSDYRSGPGNAPHAVVWRVSENLVHAISNEGGAIVISGVQENHFLAKFLVRNLNSYVILARLALHESSALKQYTSRLASLGSIQKLRSDDYSMLADVLRCLYQYRLNFRFSVVSDGPWHNKIQSLWRDAFSLEAIEKEVDADARHIVLYAEANRFATWKRAGKIVGGLLPLGALLVSVDEVFGLGVRLRLITVGAQIIHDTELFARWNTGSISAAILSILLVGFVGWKSVNPGRRPLNRVK